MTSPQQQGGLGMPSGPDFRPGSGPPRRRRTTSRPRVVPPHPVHDTPRPASVPAPPPAVPVPSRRRRPRAAAAGLALLAVVAGGVAGGVVSGALDDGDGSPASPTAEPDSGRGATGAEAAAQAVLPSVVQVRSDRGSGSGFVLDDRGHVVTNHHVIEGESDVRLLLSGGRVVEAEVVGSDATQDIAVLRTEAQGLTAVDVGSSGLLRIGEQVLAIGSPLGLSGTVTSGIVSATQRRADIGGQGEQQVIQTDASINPGNSGGPLVDLQGRVVGVNTAIATTGPGAGNIGIGFAVPIDRAARVAQRLIANG